MGKIHNSQPGTILLCLVLLVGCGPKAEPQEPTKEPAPEPAPAPEPEPEPEPVQADNEQITVRGTVAKAIQLLEAQDYARLLMEIPDPETQKEIMDDTGDPQIAAQKFAEDGKAPVLLQVLKQLQDIEPRMNEDGTQAVYELPPDLAAIAPDNEIVFIKVDGKWYITD